MKIISWLGAFALFLTVALGTAAVLRSHSNGTPLPTSPVAVAAVPGMASEINPPIVVVSPRPVAKPKAHAAAPAPIVRSTAMVIVTTQQSLINRDRAAHGLGALSWSSCLSTIAYGNALRIANQGYISHTNGPTRDLGCRLGYHAGENVGWYSAGISDTWANNAFMASPDHRANILSPYYHYVATSWVKTANGRGYVAVEFS